jgi:NADH-quinone oxidoreductase subunit G
VYRFLPRRNDAVNETWMCDGGRLGYRYVNENRLRWPLLRRGTALAETSWGAALDEAARLLSDLTRREGAAALAAIVSPHLTNEELFTLGQLIVGGLRIAQRDVAVPLGSADDFLIKAEKAANARGARELQLAAAAGETDLHAIRHGIEAGTIRGLFVTGTDLWEIWGDAAPGLFGRLEVLVVQTPNTHPLLELAHVVLPGLTFAEKNGTFTNFAGRVQRIHRALDPGTQPSDGEIFVQLGRRLGMEVVPGLFEPRAIFGEITRQVPAYGALSWDALGALGASTGDASASMAEG